MILLPGLAIAHFDEYLQFQTQSSCIKEKE
uniref:Ras-related protein RHN1-like isoform X3 n=1 Tax=Rhizophora mucronata TaxID=61149 RepID=A0A2P2P6D2_RHIMU